MKNTNYLSRVRFFKIFIFKFKIKHRINMVELFFLYSSLFVFHDNKGK